MMPSQHNANAHAQKPADAGFEADFAALLADIRSGVIERDRDRVLPVEQIRALQALGFGSRRLPSESGGAGDSVEQFFDKLIRLAAADSNVAHAFRGHIGFVDEVLLEPDSPRRRTWLDRVAKGDLVGNAQSERQATTQITTTLTREGDQLALTGTKYYTTGSIFSDWIQLSALVEDEFVDVIAPATHPGVLSVDDWDGFGQRLTGSGTTTFVDVPVSPDDVRPYTTDGVREVYLSAVFQLVLLAVVAGILHSALDDTTAFVRARRRTFGVSGESLPREDPLVQSVVGELSSAAWAARALVLSTARELDAVSRAQQSGEADIDSVRAVQFTAYRAQQIVLPLALKATGELFEVGGASAVSSNLGLDRHWRNVRTIASHNPAVQRRRALGDFVLNDRLPVWGTTRSDAEQPVSTGAKR
ncbi:hypothetical protein [Homoserinimonas hongtaonis]|uniref:hypothetical protein n=1 Tax=Homoserinimonas hongtaonis TaxID=2079791 RepID=UPI000D3B0CFE|nr:hypothetical protein [Salinibacterium hongtaonis]AWB90163.1 hypothetical protein C2138_11955 [Salinibacterium hongtaonis]